MSVRSEILSLFEEVAGEQQKTLAPLMRQAGFRYVFLGIENVLDEDLAFLKAGTLDDASWLEPVVEVWSRSAQPWSPHFEGAARLERGPA